VSRKALFLLSICWIFMGCTKEKPAPPTDVAVVDMSREPTEVLLPSSLWDQLEKTHVGLYTQSFERERELDGKGIVKFYASLPLVVTATHPETLDRGAYQLVYQDGGGTLDLARFVKANATGALKLSFGFPDEFKTSPRKVFFLSHSPKKDISGLVMGSGCDVFMDVTSHFAEAMKDGGFELFLKDRRHLAVYGGTFFLATTKASQLFLAHLKITDSRFPELMCKGS
jgi:hypothetical protein